MAKLFTSSYDTLILNWIFITNVQVLSILIWYFNYFLELKRRIELLQDFDMPGLSTTVKVTQDGQYILATGIYKPRIKCYDVNNLAMKFERCFDSEAVTFEILSNDYSKVCIWYLLLLNIYLIVYIYFICYIFFKVGDFTMWPLYWISFPRRSLL